MGQLQEKYKHYREPQKYMEADVYPTSAPLRASRVQKLKWAAIRC